MATWSVRRSVYAARGRKGGTTMLSVTKLNATWLACALGITSTASADVTTSYPAYACTFWKTSALLTSGIWDLGRVTFNVTGAATVCPAGQRGGAATGARIVVRDLSAVQGFRCTLYVTDPQLGVLTFSAARTTSAAAMGTFVLDLGPAAAATSAIHGTKYIRCTVPDVQGLDGSSLLSYSVTEL